jgi:integrase
MSELLLDRAGRRRSPATMPGFHAGRPPRNKGLRYPADPPKVEEIVAVMRAAGDGAHGRRLRGLIVILWRAGLRIQEALALAEADLDHARGALLVRHGKGGRRREVGMDAWGWEELQPWLELRLDLPIGPLFCVINGSSRGRHWASAAARAELRRKAVEAGVRRRFAPHQLRHAHAVEMAREGVPLVVIQRQLGHSNLGITSLGRDGARCRRYRRSVSPTRPPNRTCPFLSIRLSTGHAVADRDADVMQRRFPAEWWLGLFRYPPTARGCCGRDSDIGSLTPRRARRASCLLGWSSCAPSTFA